MTKSNLSENNLVNQNASLGKRLLAIFYDMLILFFIIVIIYITLQQIIINLELISLEKIQISKEETINIIPSNSIVTLILKNLWVVISFSYFAYYWTTRGQTPGMGVWKIKTVNASNNKLITIKQAIYRYVFALLGIGIFWMLFNKDRAALQDKMSQSKLIRLKP